MMVHVTGSIAIPSSSASTKPSLRPRGIHGTISSPGTHSLGAREQEGLNFPLEYPISQHGAAFACHNTRK